MEADRNDRSADGAFNFDDALYCLRIRVKQPFIFTTWTSHMHFLHIFSPPARGQPKGNVKLTVGNCFIFLCTVCRDLNPMVAINIVYRTYVLLSINLSATVVSGFPDEVMIFTNSLFPVCEPIILCPSRIHHGARCRDKSPVFRQKKGPEQQSPHYSRLFTRHPMSLFTKVFYKVPDFLLSILFWIWLPAA